MTETADDAPTHQRNDHLRAMRVARDGDTVARYALASCSDTPPEILYFLADDPDAEIRRRIAENSETPRKADLLLARDDRDDVRSVVAKKIGRLFPEVSATERKVIRRAVLDVLEVLAADETERIRELVSNTLKDASDVPQHVVKQLANDPLLTVCGPILECSPVLTDEDLLEIVASKPVQGALSAISRRASVADTVSHAIATSNDPEAVAELLANPSAQIREETLDTLIEQAPTYTAWHAPLVERPSLSADAAQRIAGFVAQSLLDTLRARSDLGTETLDAIEGAVKDRLAKEKNPPAANPCRQDADAQTAAVLAGNDAHDRAARLQRRGRLDEKAIRDAGATGDHEFVVAALTLCADVDHDTVERIVTMRSSKGVVSLCWKAGLSMALATRLQTTICSIAPDKALKPVGLSGFPLSEDEMRWVLEFFEAEAAGASSVAG